MRPELLKSDGFKFDVSDIVLLLVGLGLDGFCGCFKGVIIVSHNLKITITLNR